MNDNELKPVRCGCGGEAKVETDHDIIQPVAPIDWKRVVCAKCNIRTTWRKTEAEAITAWNKAMGTEKDCAHCVSYDKVRGYCNNYGLWIGDAFGCKDFAPCCEVNNE